MSPAIDRTPRLWKFLRVLLLLTAFWVYGIFHLHLYPSWSHLLVKAWPLVLILAAGLASAGNIIYHVVTFRRCPQAHRELLLEIDEAKRELAKKGIKIN